MSTVENLIQKLNLIPHPEGGYYCESFRSDIVIPCNFISDEVDIRNASTGIFINIVSLSLLLTSLSTLLSISFYIVNIIINIILSLSYYQLSKRYIF